jgi:hypothetical protein
MRGLLCSYVSTLVFLSNSQLSSSLPLLYPLGSMSRPVDQHSWSHEQQLRWYWKEMASGDETASAHTIGEDDRQRKSTTEVQAHFS